RQRDLQRADKLVARLHDHRDERLAHRQRERRGHECDDEDRDRQMIRAGVGSTEPDMSAEAPALPVPENGRRLDGARQIAEAPALPAPEPQNGFTLPELLVTMTLLAILLGGFGQMIITSSKT